MVRTKMYKISVFVLFVICFIYYSDACLYANQIVNKGTPQINQVDGENLVEIREESETSGNLKIMFAILWFLLSVLAFVFIVQNKKQNEKIKSLKNRIENEKKEKEQLNYQKVKYRDIFNSTDQCIILHSPVDGAIIGVNNAGCEIFGYTKEEFLSLNVGDISASYGVFTAEYAVNMIQRAANHGEHSLDWHARKKDGTFFWIRVFLKNTMIAGEQCVLALIRDVTEAKKYDLERLRLVEILESTSDMVSTSSAEKDIFYLNESGKKMLELTRDVKEYQVQDFHPKWAAELIYHVGIPEAIEKGIWRGNTAIVTEEGREIPVSQVILVHKNLRGEVDYISTIIRDITELLQQEQELRKSERMLSTILCSVADAVITTDVEGRIIFMNPTATEITGWELADVNNQKLETVFIAKDEKTNEIIENPVNYVVKSKQHKKFGPNYRLQTRDKKELPVSFVCSPIVDGEEISGAVLVFREISDERKVEAQLRHQQKLESLGTLAGGVAHEINNPINVIMNYAELVLDQLEVGSSEYEDVKQIIEESTRIATIVRNLLSFSRQEEEYKSMARVIDIVNSTSSLTQKILKKDQIDIMVGIDENLPFVRCRSQEIMQVLMNLITNARDALNDKYQGFHKDKVIRINAEKIEHDDDEFIRITVEDRGTGIESSVLEKMYDPFFSSKPRDKGTGLGLSISHGIIKDHGGFLTCETEPNLYTKFHVDLPL